MPKLKSLEELKSIREKAGKNLRLREKTDTVITVGMGTCGIAAGARETMYAILEELDKRHIHAHVATIGCVGSCANEPLVEINQSGKPRVTYGKVRVEMVPRLIEEHIVNGRVVDEWVYTTGPLQDPPQ